MLARRINTDWTIWFWDIDETIISDFWLDEVKEISEKELRALLKDKWYDKNTQK